MSNSYNNAHETTDLVFLDEWEVAYPVIKTPQLIKDWHTEKGQRPIIIVYVATKVSVSKFWRVYCIWLYTFHPNYSVGVIDLIIIMYMIIKCL